MRKATVVAGVAAAALALSGSVAVASIPDTRNGQIYGCRAVKDGALRVIDAQAGQRCRSTERAVNWSADTRRAYVVRRSAYNGWVELSTTPKVLLNIKPPTLGPGMWMLTARIPVRSDTPGTASVTCSAKGGEDSHGFEGTFSDSDTISDLEGAGRPLELQTLAMNFIGYNTDVPMPIVVECTAAPGPRVYIEEYQIVLTPVPSPVVTE